MKWDSERDLQVKIINKTKTKTEHMVWVLLREHQKLLRIQCAIEQRGKVTQDA